MFCIALSSSFIHLICVSCRRLLFCKFFCTERSLFTAACRSKEQFYFFCIAVYNYRNIISTLLIYNFFIPSRKNMKCIHAVIPLTLIEVIAIFRKSGSINDSKIGALRCRPSRRITRFALSCSIPRRRFSDIVKSCPYIFSRNKITLDYFIPCAACRSAPTNCRCIIGCQIIIAIICLTAHSFINASAINCRCSLRAIQTPFRIFLMNHVIMSLSWMIFPSLRVIHTVDSIGCVQTLTKRNRARLVSF